MHVKRILYTAVNWMCKKVYVWHIFSIYVWMGGQVKGCLRVVNNVIPHSLITMSPF